MQRRHAVRALLLAGDEVLLIHTYIPDSGKLIWLTPGGGQEAGESAEDCLFREVAEETGRHFDQHNGLVWQRRQKFKLHDEAFDQSEDYYLIRTNRFDANNGDNPAELEKAIFRGFRWWSLAQIASSDEIFVPLTLAKNLADVIERGIPSHPLQVGL